MGRFKALPLMMSLLLLAGCGGRRGERTAEQMAVELQKDYAALEAVTCRVALTADYETRVFDCVLDVVWDRATGAGLTLVEPDIAKGVTARVAHGETSLRYGEFSLDTGPLTDEGISPMEAVPTLWRQLTTGYIAAAALEDDVLEITLRRGEEKPGTGLEAVMTFDAKSRAPLAGELFWNGRRVVTARVENFQSMSAKGSL